MTQHLKAGLGSLDRTRYRGEPGRGESQREGERGGGQRRGRGGGGQRRGGTGQRRGGASEQQKKRDTVNRESPSEWRAEQRVNNTTSG